jgi:hypothetical protein
MRTATDHVVELVRDALGARGPRSVRCFQLELRLRRIRSPEPFPRPMRQKSRPVEPLREAPLRARSR